MELHHDALYITGGKSLQGEVHIHAAKNSVLYLMMGALLTREKVVLENIPKLSDILILCEMLEHFGASARWHGRDLHIEASEIFTCDAPYTLVSQLRASFVAMGALLGRCGEANISMPGGCAFGPRPVDRHIKAFRQIGVEIGEAGGDFQVRRTGALEGRATFEVPTVGGTQNVILASVLGAGHVTIENAALEPEIADLAQMLNAMGAKVRGAGTSTISIEGVASLRGVTYRPVPDRIEAGTFMLAAAATRGQVTLHNVNPDHLRAVIRKLSESGVVVTENARTLHVDAAGTLTPVDVTASEYPGLPTDLQAPFGAFLATVPGISTLQDRVYPDRFTHVGELARTEARLELQDRTLFVQGGTLTGAQMHAADIRAGGALVIAALAAEGESVITGVRYIERGYEGLEKRLCALGAHVVRGQAPELVTKAHLN